jgi:HlyD family secretion protein
MRKGVLLLALASIAALVWWAIQRKSQPPEISFVRSHRETLVSNLITNGKVEPVQWQDVRVDNQGLVTAVPLKEGHKVAAGALIARLSEPGLKEELDSARERETAAKANLQTLKLGGKTVELAQIESDLLRAKADHDQALREYNSLHRLQEKQAATVVEVEVAHDKVRQAELEIAALERHRMSIVSAQDLAAGQARVAEAESAVRLAQVRLAQGQIYAPVSGVVYSLPARPGTYLNPGDLVASIGNIDHLRVRVYVDEPELGRIQVGQPVKITWDGLPGHAWEGTVEKKPAAIVPLGTRQVGEVQVTIANPNHDLVPGTNINAEIRTNVVNNALVIPKETMHRENGITGVYLLRDDRVVWRPVKVGVASVTRAQIIEGLADNDAVALPSDRTLKNGDAVRPITQ